MRTLDEYLAQEMSDPKFSREYDNLQPEREVMRALSSTRAERGITQEELSRRTGIRQSEISRIENGTRNPSVRVLQRLAEGLGCTLRIEFEAKDATTQMADEELTRR